MKAPFRKGGSDIAPESRKVTDRAPGTLPMSKVPIETHDGRRLGHVGRLASEACVSRWGVQATLQKRNGRDTWVGKKPVAPQPTAAKRPDQKHSAQVAQARGSVTHAPTKPETHARPHRGH